MLLADAVEKVGLSSHGRKYTSEIEILAFSGGLPESLLKPFAKDCFWPIAAAHDRWLSAQWLSRSQVRLKAIYEADR